MVDEPRAVARPAQITPQPAPDEAAKREDERRKRQEENNKKAAEVMEKSTPFPTQEQVDKAKLGLLKPDEVQAPEQPEMPPLHEQRQDETKPRR